MKKYLLGILTGIIITCGIVFAAEILMDAKNISFESEYTKKDNVADAINELLIGGSKVIYLGTGTSFDLNNLKETGKIPDNLDLDNLTIDNFIVGVDTTNQLKASYCTGNKYGCSSSYVNGYTLTKSYSSGVLSIDGTTYQMGTCIASSAKYCTDGRSTGSVAPFAYLVIGKIE